MKIRAEDIVARLPTREIINQARTIANDRATVPGVRALSYTVQDGARYTGSVILSNGKSYKVNFNLLDPVAAVEGIADLISNSIIDAI